MLGYYHDEAATSLLRNAAELSWMKNTIHVFRKVRRL
jgi:hypothetical protein